MDVPQTTAQLIAAAIRTWLQPRTVRFGLLARNLPPFDAQTVYEAFADDLAQPDPPLRLALIGFTLTSPTDSTYVTTSVEQAVAWRNDASITKPLVVLLNPQGAHEKIHSLELLEPFEDADLRRAICLQGQERSSNPPEKVLWQVLLRKDVVQGLALVAEQLAQYYTALEHGEPLGDALPHLSLLRDPDLANNTHDRNLLGKRLKANHDQVQRLLNLDKKDYRALGRALDHDQSGYQRTFLAIQEYTRQPGYSRLNKEYFTLAAVQDLFAARATEPIIEPLVPEPSTPGSTTVPGSATRNSNDMIFDLMLSLEPEHQEILADLAHEENEAYREDPTSDLEPDHSDDTPVIKRTVDGQEVTLSRFSDPEDKHPLEILMRQWVRDDVWGGLIDAREGIDPTLPVPRLFDGSTVLPAFHPFTPLQNGSLTAPNVQPSLRSLLTALDRVLPQADDEQLADLLMLLSEKRAELAPYRIRFLYQPTRAVFDQQMFRRIADYVQTYERLASRLQDIYRQVLEQYPDTIEQATAQFLALDSVIIARRSDVDRRGGEVVLLTTSYASS